MDNADWTDTYGITTEGDTLHLQVMMMIMMPMMLLLMMVMMVVRRRMVASRGLLFPFDDVGGDW